MPNGGGLAEYVVANESLTVPRPAEVSAAEGAGLTALQALINPAEVKLDGTGPRKSILASYGCLGCLGADDVLDYKTPEGAALKSPSGQKYDAVIHCTTGIPWSTFEPNLSSSGKVIDITPGVSAMWTFAIKKLTFSKKQFVPLHLIPKKENLELIVGLLKEGKLKTVIDSKFPLSKAEDAWSKSSDGHATGHLPCMLVQFVIWLFPSIMSFDFVFFAF
ncbi:chloroplast envelope quinone oxidoreductase homolog [Solanum verrucosum]|uniref:chloroplast envelope quinone oxidoreductase homolog n=1 Tax=Solanum verrucosum TaxID=315347 RepID=UPI0020D0E89A|nr:chloroplast envelope quinone oxidoreductase homolog [Solanum verrucosum]